MARRIQYTFPSVRAATRFAELMRDTFAEPRRSGRVVSVIESSESCGDEMDDARFDGFLSGALRALRGHR